MKNVTLLKIEKTSGGRFKFRFSNGQNITFANKELMQDYTQRSKEPEIMRKAISDILTRDPNLTLIDNVKDVEFSLSEPEITRAQR